MDLNIRIGAIGDPPLFPEHADCGLGEECGGITDLLGYEREN